MEKSVTKVFPVEKPATEKELGLELRQRALGSKALQLLVRDEGSIRNYILENMLIQVGDQDRLPRITGTASELIGDSVFNAGAGRLDVIDPDLPENQRRLLFTVVEPLITDQDETLSSPEL